MINITKKFREQFSSKMDIVKYAESNGLSTRELQMSIAIYDSKGTPCEGCQYFVSNGVYPCTVCCRNKKDMFEQAQVN